MHRRSSAQPENTGASTTALFLSLYLIILAFFILLNAYSQRQETRTAAVLGSLGTTFSEVFVSATGPLEAARGPDAFGALGELEDEVRELFESVIPLVKVTPYLRYSQLLVEVPIDGMYAPGEASVRTEAAGLLDRLAEVLRREMPGQRFELEAVVSLPGSGARKAGPGRDLAARRAAVLAREMGARGVQPDAVAAGVADGDVAALRLSLFIREADEPRIWQLR